jgi:hypothetical protein
LAASANINVNINAPQLKQTLDDLKKLTSFINKVNAQSASWQTAMQGMPATWQSINRSLVSVTRSMNRFATISQTMATAAAGLASSWQNINQSTNKTNTTMNNLNSKTANMAQTSSTVASNFKTLNANMTSAQKSVNSMASQSNNFQNNMKKTSTHSQNVFHHITGVFSTLRTMASGGGGVGSIGQLAGQFGMFLGAPGVALGAVLGTAITAIGFSIQQAVDYRTKEAQGTAVGMSNPFGLQAYGNFLTKYTGGEAQTAQLFGQLANTQATLGGPEFQRNWAKRFGQNIRPGESPEDLIRHQILAEAKMAKTVRPELWKTTAQAWGVGDLVDTNRLWRFKTGGDTQKEIREQLDKAKDAEDAAKLSKEAAKTLNDTAEEWGKLELKFESAFKTFAAAVDTFASLPILKWFEKTADNVKEKAPEAVEGGFGFGKLLDIWKYELKAGGSILDFIFPKAKAGTLDDLQNNKDGQGGTNADATAKLGPYNVVAAAKIPDNIQEIRDILYRLLKLVEAILEVMEVAVEAAVEVAAGEPQEDYAGAQQRQEVVVMLLDQEKSLVVCKKMLPGLL